MLRKAWGHLAYTRRRAEQASRALPRKGRAARRYGAATMSFLFSKKPRGPADLVKQTKEALLKLEGTDNKAMAKVRAGMPCLAALADRSTP